MNKSIFLQPINGLGNRLRSINSYYKLALHKNRSLKIFWASSGGFSDVSFEDLFDLSSIDSSIEFIDEPEFSKVRKKFLCLDEYVKQNSDSNYLILEKESVLNSILNDSFCSKTSSCLEHVFSFDNSITKIYNSNSSDPFLSSLMPSSGLSLNINSILKKFQPNTLGIHIRRGDAINGPWKSKYLSPSVEDFCRKISDHNGNVFLSTDCFKIQKKMTSLFRNKVIVNESKKFNSSDLKPFDEKPYQKDAVIDMFCLSSCFRVYGSNWSTFSQVSSLLPTLVV